MLSLKSNVKSLIDLPLSRTFSHRNQFGSSSMLCIVEAAIRQIIPLVSIVKLPHGNIGSKGNATCMWDQSQLCTILPNLPSTCQYFVLSYEAQK